MATSSDDDFPSAKECMKTIAVAEAEKASDYMRRQSAAEAEKRALMERFEKPSGVSDEERLKREASESNNTTGGDQGTHGGSGHSVPEHRLYG